MVNFLKELNLQILITILLFGALFLMFRDRSSPEEKSTRSTMNLWAEKLDRNVKPSGVYIQWDTNELPENDAWGTPLRVDYKNEAVAERVFVKSAGEDMVWGSEDDLRVSKMQINAKGIGEGIKEHTSEVAKEATKGVAAGVKEEAKQSVASTKQNIKNATLSAKQKATSFLKKVKEKREKNKDEEVAEQKP